MLVLSRRTGESVIFPGLGVSLEVSQIRNSHVTLGIDAPRKIRILRGELAGAADLLLEPTADGSTLSHEIRNQLNTVSLALHAMELQMQSGGECDPRLLRQAIEELHRIDELTVDRAADQAVDQAVDQNPTGVDESTPPAPFRSALLVEDNENELTLLSGFLSHTGFDVTTALDGEAALSYLETSASVPDVALLDMNMPRMGGVELIRRIRQSERWKRMPIFAVSGAERDSLALPEGNDGVNYWFQKPVRPDRLVRKIEEILAT